MKICFFNSDFPPKIGGISTFSWSLAYHMSKRKEVHKIQVISFKHKEFSKEKYNEKLSIIRLPLNKFFSTAKEIYKYIYKFRNYDVFHATNIFPVGFLVILLGKFIFRKKVFITFYGTDVLSTKASKKTKLAKYFTLKYADKAITISNSTLKQTCKYYKINPNKFSMIYYSLANKKINLNNNIRKKIRKKYNLLNNDFVILTVANLVKRKGTADLIKTISLINNFKIKLLVVGQGPELINLKKLTQELKLENRIIFTGLVENVDVFYNSADIFSLPSYFIKEQGDIEGLGIVFLEAQQYALPVIGTNSGGIPETIDNRKSGFIVNERSPEEIKEKILLLSNNKELYSRMSRRARQFVKEKFNWDKAIKQYLELYV